MLIKLKTKILHKYNKLYKEIAIYYGMEDKLNISAFDAMYYITPQGFGINRVTASSAEIISHLKENFIYFVPFYKFQCYQEFSDLSAREFFQNMNSAIEKMREEKLVIKNL